MQKRKRKERKEKKKEIKGKIYYLVREGLVFSHFIV